jgi:hypothetical protein
MKLQADQLNAQLAEPIDFRRAGLDQRLATVLEQHLHALASQAQGLRVASVEQVVSGWLFLSGKPVECKTLPGKVSLLLGRGWQDQVILSPGAG